MISVCHNYMMYLPVSHSIAVTIILRSAFCVLQNTPAGLWSKITQPTGQCFTHPDHRSPTKPQLHPFFWSQLHYSARAEPDSGHR